MRSLSWCLGLLLLASCGGESVAPFARLNGVHGLTHVGSLVFVTSAQGSELRVIDSLPDPVLRRDEPGFLRAPNPLNLLSIPVLDRPVRLTPDLHWTAGAELRGPYLYVEGAGAREISVVAAAPEFLQEVARLSANGPVTSVAGLGPATDADPSLLFHAEDQAGLGRLFVTALAGPSRIESEPPLTQAVRRQDGSPIAFADETLVAMTVLPRAEGGGVRLAVALRGVLGHTGRSLLLTLDPDGTQLTAEPLVLDFGGPVRELRTHGTYLRLLRNGSGFPLDANQDRLPDGTTLGLEAGSRIFGLLDEEACGGLASCRGVVAVDAITRTQAAPWPALTEGQRSLDARGLPMLPIADGNAMIQSFAVQPGLTWLPPQPGVTDPPLNVFDLGGILSAGTGNFTMFDADALQQVNIATSGPAIATTGPAFVTETLRLRDVNGAEIGGFNLDPTRAPLIAGAADLSLNPGVIREETIAFTFQGAIPGLAEVPVTGAGVSATFGIAPDAAKRVRPGDGVRGSGPGCETSLVVDAVDPGAGTVTTSPALAAGCATVTFSVGTTDPWVVRGSESGYLGRTAGGQVFTSEAGTPFAHLPTPPERTPPPQPPLPTYVPGAPAMTLRFVLPPDFLPTAGQSVTVITTDGFAPLRSRVNTDAAGGLPFALPARPAHRPPGSGFYPGGSVWVAYPSANAVISFAPAELNPLSSFAKLRAYQ